MQVWQSHIDTTPHINITNISLFQFFKLCTGNHCWSLMMKSLVCNLVANFCFSVSDSFKAFAIRQLLLISNARVNDWRSNSSARVSTRSWWCGAASDPRVRGGNIAVFAVVVVRWATGRVSVASGIPCISVTVVSRALTLFLVSKFIKCARPDIVVVITFAVWVSLRIDVWAKIFTVTILVYFPIIIKTINMPSIANSLFKVIVTLNRSGEI